MHKDPTAFRERFNKWKSGLLVYDKGKPITDNTLIDLVKKVNTSDANFVQRLKDPNRKYIQDWAYKNMIATHKLGVATDEQGNHYIYPEVQEINGKLVDFTRPPYASWVGQVAAEERGDTVRVPSIEDGLLFTENYKKYYPKGKTFNEGKEQLRPMFNYIDRAVRYIAQHEGFVNGVYEDRFASQDYAKKNGYWSNKYKRWVLPTAGYGWTAKKDLHKWTREEANKRLREDVVKYDQHGRNLIQNWDRLPDEHKMAIMDLFHLGGLAVLLKKMPKFYAALKRGDKDAGRYLAFASTQTPTRNKDRIALWNNATQYRQNEFNLISKRIVKEKTTHYEPVDFVKYRKPILPEERLFEYGVPEYISLEAKFDTAVTRAIKALNNLVALNKLIQSISLENLNPQTSEPQMKDIMNGQSYFLMAIPQITTDDGYNI